MSQPLPQDDGRDPNTRGGSLQVIAEALRGLEFGSVTVIVQDGRIIQVERTERKRLVRPRQSR